MPPKKSDARSSKFIAKHGEIAVELDAVPPDVMQHMIRDAISEHFDEDVHEDVLMRQEKEREEIREKIEKILPEEDEDDDE